MKQINATVTLLKDSLRTATPTPPAPPSQQELLKQRAKILQKQLENLRAKTTADMVSDARSLGDGIVFRASV